MMWKKVIIVLVLVLSALDGMAQSNGHKFIRSGNRKFRDSLYNEAEVFYRKALEQQPTSVEGAYNLGTTLLRKRTPDFKQAIESLQSAAKLEKDKKKLGDIYHNIGVAYQFQKQLEECIEAYKMALRNNPKNDETRYNLVLAQKQLKKQQQQQQQEQDKDKQQQEKQKQQQKNQEQQNQKQNNQQQNQMSKDAAEQLLNSIMQDERNVQDKVKKGMQVSGRKLEKDW